MFHQISWFTYFLAFVLVAGLYYGIILPVFFKKQMGSFFSRQRTSSSHSTSSDGTGTGVHDYTTYEKLRDEITAYLEGEDQDTFKSDILFAVASIIKRHPPLQDERFRGALGKEIRRLYNGKYNDSLSEDELTAIWQV